MAKSDYFDDCLLKFKSFMSSVELGLFKNPGWGLIQFYFVILVFIF